MSKENQQKIGYLIKSLRRRRGLTQKEFADLLKTSQSAVARMEKGDQNFTTKELSKISEVLNHSIISVSDSIDFEIHGGKKLKGSISVNTSKNGALFIMFGALLNKGKTILRDVPKIEDINRVLELFENIGVNVRWIDEHDLEIIPPKKFKIERLLHESAGRIRSGLMLMGSLIHFEREFKLSQAGGCKMGLRTIAAHSYGLEELGIQTKVEKDGYRVFVPKNKKVHGAKVVMYEMSDTATANVLFAAARIPEETIIKFASSNYQVQDVCFFLQNLGVRIEGVGTSTLKVKGISEINTDIEHYVSEDPTEAMMFLAAGIVTSSEITIQRTPIDFLELELLKLKKMGLKYEVGKGYKSKNGRTNLADVKIKPSKLKALDDKIHAQPYPGINTDNLPFFASIAAFADGITLIHDWMWENRAIYFTELNRLGVSTELMDSHRIKIFGNSDGSKYSPAQIVCPPALRPATIILIAMLGIEGKSILRNVYSIRRGYEEITKRLNSLGADIRVIKGV
jgi:UDP-N-acetylglucosamine 1-carboxyvinyltransferase